MGDIFSSVFGNMGFDFGGRTSSNSRPNAPRRGQDITYNLDLTFEESYLGVEKKIVVNRNEECKECNGTGSEKEQNLKHVLYVMVQVKLYKLLVLF